MLSFHKRFLMASDFMISDTEVHITLVLRGDSAKPTSPPSTGGRAVIYVSAFEAMTMWGEGKAHTPRSYIRLVGGRIVRPYVWTL